MSQSQKVVEFYMKTLKEYTEKLKKEKGTDKITLLLQVGEFFEIYGLIYPDGTREGNVWQFCDDTNLKVAAKPQVVYGRPEIQVFMGGVGESYINPYIQKAVDQFGWTIIIFDQHRIGNTDKFERKEQTIISPGVNINSDNFSNTTIFIYMDRVKSYFKTASNIGNASNSYIINIGLAYIDCLTGENGIMAINNAGASDISIPLDELLKILTIKNPRELVIFLENIDTGYITDDDLITALHLFNYNYKIIREAIPEQTHKPSYQLAILENVYIKHRGLMDISQQLGIDGAEHIYSRIALVLLVEFITKHDRTIIQKLELPEIIVNSDKYLMLANNCLEQLDIIYSNTGMGCSMGSSKGGSGGRSSSRMSLLELLDNTRTPLGKLLLRQRLSIPITIPDILETRYSHISELYNLHEGYMISGKTSTGNPDKYGSPLYQLRQKLGNVKNIENYLRKIITAKLQPFEVSTYLESLTACDSVINYLTTLETDKVKLDQIKLLIPSENNYKAFASIIRRFKEDLILDNLGYNVWNGVVANPFVKGISGELDKLQDEINNDQSFLDNLLVELSVIIDSKFNKIDDKPLVSIGENASKGIYIFTNTSRKDILEKYFNSKTGITVGNYKITGKDINFLKMKESKWEIEIPFLKVSNGSLKVNIDRLGRIAKAEFMKWLNVNIISSVERLDSLSSIAHFIAELDVIQSNVINAIQNGYTRPIITMNDNTKSHSNSYIKSAAIRHPIIEYISKSSKYVPNDISLGGDCAQDGMLLFGVNAVGKSSLMKSVGVNIIMAQAGMYVASSRFEYKPFKYLFTRILGNDNLYAGLSSFEVEMKEFKVILKYANEDSILLCDELFRGTQVNDAEALVASGLEILSERKVKFVSATHLHSLTQMKCIKDLKNIKPFHLLVEQDKTNPRKLIYSRKLLPGSGPASYGIMVADAMNIDDAFVTRAKEIRLEIDMRVNSGSGSGGVSEIRLGSKYNKDKVLGMCNVCQNNIAVDVHHINQQCDANGIDLIDTLDSGIFNKNKLWNLVALCKACHQAVHSSPVELKIEGYITTTSGIELKYIWLDSISQKDNVNQEQPKQPIQADSIVIDKLDDILDDKLDIIPVKNSNKPGKINKISKGIEKDLAGLDNDMRANVIEFIKTMKFGNATPKKIQFDVKRKYDLDITQQFIRDIN